MTNSFILIPLYLFSSFPLCNDLEIRHLFGRYRLLYSSFVRCVKYLDRLRDLIQNKKYDYALVAAGAYGLPIGKFLKENRLSTIYLGGALQLLFGVFGARWKNRSVIDLFRTSYWLEHPLEAPPRGASFIEGKTYW